MKELNIAQLYIKRRKTSFDALLRIRPKSHVHYNVRPPFHAHIKKHQPSLTSKTGVSSSSVIAGKGRIVSTPVVVHAPSISKGNSTADL